MSETRFFYSEKALTIVLGELSTIRRGLKRFLYCWFNRKSERKTDLAKIAIKYHISLIRIWFFVNLEVTPNNQSSIYEEV